MLTRVKSPPDFTRVQERREQGLAFTSSYEPVEPGGTTLPRLVFEAAARDPRRAALRDGSGGPPTSYGLLAAQVRSIATALRARGFASGDVLALRAPNSPEWAAVAFGAMAAGGSVTGANPAATEEELARQLAGSRGRDPRDHSVPGARRARRRPGPLG
jgi:acyl-CoA synthetase (AMP-forming)/AMP-acid ligase II